MSAREKQLRNSNHWKDRDEACSCLCPSTEIQRNLQTNQDGIMLSRHVLPLTPILLYILPPKSQISIIIYVSKLKKKIIFPLQL